jgi:restriction endonuclease Mrr
VRQENLKQAAHAREDFRNMTMADVEQRAEHMPWGRPDEVADRLIVEADKAGANTLLVSLNRGAMPHEMFLEQVRRFGREVMPRLQAHEVKRVPIAEAAAAARAAE